MRWEEPETGPAPKTIEGVVVGLYWDSFKGFNRYAIVTAATHALAMVRSHYPATDLQAIGGGFAKGLSEEETQQLEDEVEDAAKKLAGDIDLFSKMDGSGRAQ